MVSGLVMYFLRLCKQSWAHKVPHFRKVAKFRTCRADFGNQLPTRPF